MKTFTNISCTLFVLLSTFFLVLIIINELPIHSGIEHTQNHAIFSFLFGNEDISFLTNAEQEHMHDVKNLLRGCFIILLITGFLSFKKRVDFSFVGKGLVGIVVVLGLASIGFTRFWTFFHKVFFPQGNWQFPSNSIIISLYPEQYFLGFMLLLIGIWLIVAGIFLFWNSQK